MSVNYLLFRLINDNAGRSALLDGPAVFAAQYLIFVVFAIAAALGLVALVARRMRPLVQIAVTLLLAFLMATVLNHLSRQLRPFQSHQVHQLIAHDGGVSLPSDHATAAFTLAFAIAMFLSRRWGIVLLIAAVLIGFARIWVGVHYPGDILAAAVVAGLAVLEVTVASRWRRSLATTSTGS
jgi:undecaprenyl-diphosphatase